MHNKYEIRKVRNMHLSVIINNMTKSCPEKQNPLILILDFVYMYVCNEAAAVYVLHANSERKQDGLRDGVPGNPQEQLPERKHICAPWLSSQELPHKRQRTEPPPTDS